MLQAIRDRATGWIAYTIIILICIPFAFWGINSYLEGGGTAEVAEINGLSISQQEFQLAYQQERMRLQEVLGDSASLDLFNDARIKSDVLQRLIDNAILEQTAEAEGLRVGDERLSIAIQELPTFQENGQFSPVRYQQWLGTQANSATGFEEEFRTRLITSQLRAGLAGSVLLTQAEQEQLIALLQQKRDISYFSVKAGNYLEKVEIDDTALADYYQENEQRFQSPERIKLQYLELDIERMAADIKVTDDELQQDYDEQIERFGSQEERAASDVRVPLPEDADAAAVEAAEKRAQEIHAALLAGEKTFAELLQESETAADLEGSELGLILKGTMESAFEEALYGLEKIGDFSAPVRTLFGFHIIRVDDITPEEVKPFDEVKEELARERKLSLAGTTFFDAAETLANASFENPDSLQPAAEALDLEIKETDFLTAASVGGIAQYPKLKRVLFSQEVKDGLNSEAIEVEPNHVIVVRMLEYDEARPLTLEEAREQVEADLRRKLAAEKVLQEAERLQTRLSKGAQAQKLAEESGHALNTPGFITRDSTEDIPREVLTEAFRLAKPKDGKPTVGITALGDGDQAVIVLNQIEPGKKEDLDEETVKSMVQRMENELGRAEFDAFMQSRRQRADIITYGDRL